MAALRRCRELAVGLARPPSRLFMARTSPTALRHISSSSSSSIKASSNMHGGDVGRTGSNSGSGSGSTSTDAGSNAPTVLRIGDVSLTTPAPAFPERVPLGYVPASPIDSQALLRHLRWILQKDVLGQDVFLIGPPGPARRRLALQYCELAGREVEYIALSKDTTEADIKQRREIVAGTAHYVDQCAVRAALSGRVLVLEGKS